MTKVNYRIHTETIKERLIPPPLTRSQTVTVYASEAELLNTALFGMNAIQWRLAVLIHQGLTALERLAQLNVIAIMQMHSLAGVGAVKLPGKRTNHK